MLNCLASLAMSTIVLKALPGKLDIKRHSPSILYILSVKNNTLTITVNCVLHRSSKCTCDKTLKKKYRQCGDVFHDKKHGLNYLSTQRYKNVSFICWSINNEFCGVCSC